MKLVIANKTYSSWSLRAFLALKATGEAFEEVLVRLDEPTTSDEIARYSPARRVPVLVDGDITIWDSLAIAEYLAERFPSAGLWPENAVARAHARSIAAEMHAGFPRLRNAYPMNLRREGKPLATPAPEADADIARVCEIWRNARAAYGAGGPFLFGSFSAADAFYAPVAARFRNYGVPRGDVEGAYIDAIFAHPAMVEWAEDAALEPWIVPSDEVE